MAHAAPASGAPRTPRTTRGPGPAGDRRPPDILEGRAHTAAKWAAPVALGLAYGCWAAANARGGSGVVTGWNVLFGFVTALVFMAAYAAVRAVAPRLRRETHALVWALFSGVAFGFLWYQAGPTMLSVVILSLIIAACVYVTAFYRFYTHEDAQGHYSPHREG
ncbi:hypothetical protein ACFY93_14630 [Streptomyces sp. NPDC008313]|uniref:hypothetical protein n=1 Tax=Streptomyces sp. NPDC008313 TaxID=3364826 RepID=UPI0036DFCBC3